MVLTCELLGERITQARRTSGRHLAELAQEIDLPTHLLHCFEKGLRWPRLDTLGQIADATGFPLIWFIDDWPEEEAQFLVALEEEDIAMAIDELEKELWKEALAV